MTTKRLVAGIGLLLTSAMLFAQSNAAPEDFTAIAIVNNNLGSGAGSVIINIERWTPDAERTALVNTLLQHGPNDLLDKLRNARAVGTIRTPDSLGYDLRYAHQEPAAEGGRRIVIATDRPISFWEASHQPRTVDYPFTVIQMQLDREGIGKGTMSYATKIRVKGETIELENFATSPVMLTRVKAEKK